MNSRVRQRVIRPVSRVLLVAFTAAWPAPAWALREAAVVERPKTLSGLEEALGGPEMVTRRRALFQLAGVLLGTGFGAWAGAKAAALAPESPAPQPSPPSAPWKPPVFIGVGVAAGAFVGHGLGESAHEVTAQMVLERRLDEALDVLDVALEVGQHIPSVILVSPDVAAEATVRGASGRFLKDGDRPGLIVAPLSDQALYSGHTILRVVAAVSETVPAPSVDTVYVAGLGGHPADNLLPVILAEVLARWLQDTRSYFTGWVAPQAQRQLPIMTVDLTPYSAARDLDAEWVWKVFADRFA